MVDEPGNSRTVAGGDPLV